MYGSRDFSREKITKLKIQNPEAKIIAHPECEDIVLELADYIGSTSGLLKFVQSDSAQAYIVATEVGILHQMSKVCPTKPLFPLRQTTTVHAMSALI